MQDGVDALFRILDIDIQDGIQPNDIDEFFKILNEGKKMHV